MKHCTDWGSFETFPCPQKGDPPLKHLQALGSPPGSISKTFSSSCCLCTCLPPVALTWQCLKLLPLISPPTTASDVQSLLDTGEDGHTQPWALRGALSSHGSRRKHGNLTAQLLPSGWGSRGTSVSVAGPPPSPQGMQAVAAPGEGPWHSPVLHCRGSPRSEPCAGSTRIWLRAFQLGFYSCAVPTARLGAPINIFRGAQNSTDLLLCKQARSPSIKGKCIGIRAGALNCLG